MKRSEAIQALRKFLSSQGLSVLALSGRWGVGKTYLIKEFLRGDWPRGDLNGVSYVSLFGAASIESLRLKATENMILRKNRAEVLERYKTRAKEALLPYDALFPASGRILRFLSDGWSGLASDAAYWFVRDSLIVLDDIERSDGSVTPTMIMGFVDELRTRGCKVILVLNRERVENREAYDTYWEKIVDADIALTPSISDDIAFAFGTEGRWAAYAEWAKGVFQEVRADNLRVQKRAAWLVQEIDPLIAGKSADLQQFVVTHAVTLAWALLDPDARVPAHIIMSTEYGYFYLSMMKSQKKEKELSREEAIWAEASERLRFSPASFDRYLIELLQTGWCDNHALSQLLGAVEDEFRQESARLALRRAHLLYAENFSFGQAEFRSELRKVITDWSASLDVFSMDAALAQLRQLGDDTYDVATAYIMQHPDHLQRVAEAVDRHQKLQDPLLRAEIERREREHGAQKYSIDSVAQHFATNDSWSGDQVTYLASRTPKDFRDWIDSKPQDLRRKIRAVLALRQYSGAEYTAAAAPLEVALSALANESEFQRKRIEDVYGVGAAK